MKNQSTKTLNPFILRWSVSDTKAHEIRRKKSSTLQSGSATTDSIHDKARAHHCPRMRSVLDQDIFLHLRSLPRAFPQATRNATPLVRQGVQRTLYENVKKKKKRLVE